MLSQNQKEVLKDHVYRLLWDEGMKIESDELVAAMLKCGCRESPSGRVRIPRELIEEMADVQKGTQQQDDEDQQLHFHCGIDWTHYIVWHGQQEQIRKKLRGEFLMSAFDCGPTTYYDYRQGKSVPADTDILIEMKKFAQATDEIGYIAMFYRHGVPPQIERIESLAMSLKYTDKIAGIEAIYPEVIKYLKEASEIITDRPGDSSYLAGSECITSPLIIESRSAEDILERQRTGVSRYHVASMPTIGMAIPVTPAGAVVMTAAELVGGMVACHVVDPGSDLSARPICLVADMRNANNTASGPEVTLVDLAVKDLFDTWWGGHCWVEVFFSTYAHRPGLQAVYENFCGAWRYGMLTGKPDIPYPGMGTLGNGGTGSPTQFMLDMDIRKSQAAMSDTLSLEAEYLPFAEICETVRNDGHFLTSDHTMRHFRELWSSPLFLTEDPSGGAWAGDEKAILDRCDEMWRENLKNYEPPQWPDEKARAMDDILARAKKEFSIE